MSPTFPRRPYLWQRATWAALLDRVAQARLPHALLFSGADGLGKRDLAVAFSHYLLCESPSVEGACGGCRSCRLLEAGNHPDLLVVEPEEEGKELTVGQVRGLGAYQALKPQYSGRKVVLLAPADRMNVNASNALLKTLEEPTDGTLLLLVTDRPAGLLPTIRSRCQFVTFSAPAADGGLIAWLTSGTGLNAEAAAEWLAVAYGAPLRARQLAEEGGHGRETVWAGLLQAAGGEAAISEIGAQWQTMGAEKAFHWAYRALCELVRFRSTGGSSTLGGGETSTRVHALVNAIDLKALFRLLDRAQEAGRLLRSHANGQLLIEEFLINWTSLFQRRQPH